MAREQLMDKIRQLHQLLVEVREPDEATRVLLEQVSADIQSVLKAQNVPQSAPISAAAPPSESPGEQLRLALLGFEARHPQLSEVVERITDGLAAMGI